jgi:tryptophan synthase beta chain
VSQGVIEGLLEPQAIDQVKCYEAALLWARTEGNICAPETSHAIASAIDEAVKAREEGKEKNILFCFSGHGLMDLSGYEKFLNGELKDSSLPEELLQEAISSIRHHPRPNLKKTGKW